MRVGVVSSLANIQLVKEISHQRKIDVSRFVYASSDPLSSIDTDQIRDAEILFGEPSRIVPVLKQINFTNLKWIHSSWAGVNMLMDAKEYIPEGCTITRTAGYFGRPMAEYCLGHIIARERSFTKYGEDQKKKVWNQQEYRPLSSLVMGILGTGDIGTEVARISSEGFGMKVWGLRRSMGPAAPHFEKIFPSTELSTFLGGLDYLVNILPATSDTFHLLSGSVLSSCKPGCVFINVGRGTIIDEDSIIKALDEKWIAGAVLDVMEKEPQPTESKLWERSDVTITPHVAAMSLGRDVVEIFLNNLEAYPNDLKYRIDISKGY
eukprot:TRINITY_DN2922_c0_g1_i1.p1 TRINITY_DN2922_c0_g1~~TRINITY_DN2922_c0_g1_i1.p1  ORF type:complete len:321 (+),score=58.97 TRINITY_DN2922_c0_g1_i1:757-1719(+)